MNPLIQEKLLDLLVNFIAIILGGGLITLIIEWRRHQRERLAWQREDELIQIDIPRSDMTVSKWQISENTLDKDKLLIYENKLEDTVKQLVAIAEFVIRNTTAAEIIITKYDAEILQIPSGDDNKLFYELETYDLISVEDIGAIRLRPYATEPRILVLVSQFGKDRKLDFVPTTLVISAKTSSGKIIQGKSTLRVVPKITDVEVYKGMFHPKKYVAKIREPEVPF